ncbi:MAG: replicative DNA helicase [Candidatus Neomarinimicrobiota bacterium]|nr:replicative DNA helicase [Candidatus Neomarinimicrobiota bacterium]
MNEENTELRIPPHSIEAEKALLGCILIENKALTKVVSNLQANSFYKPSHSKIYKAMLELFEENETIDSITVVDKLQKKGDLENVGGAFYISSLTTETASSENVEYYAKIVANKSILRNIILTSIDLSTLAYEAQNDVTSILDKAEQKLFELSQNFNRGSFVQIEEMLHNVLDKWGNHKKGQFIGVASGFKELDKKLSGFQKSDLIILAGRPSMGKTALALSMARNAAVQHNMKVGIFSLEMSCSQLTERLITAEAKVDSHLVRDGRLPAKDWKKLSKAAGSLSKAQIFIDDSAEMNIMELKAKARRLKAEKDIDCIIIDYLQLLNVPGRTESRQQEISYISRSLKALAKDLDVPVIALSQLSRALEARQDKRPMMSDLRESGAIEQDADVVLFVYRPIVYSKKEEDEGLGEIIISKHRNGPTGVVEVIFIDKYARFENMKINADEYYNYNFPG